MEQTRVRKLDTHPRWVIAIRAKREPGASGCKDSCITVEVCLKDELSQANQNEFAVDKLYHLLNESVHSYRLDLKHDITQTWTRRTT